MPVQTFKDSLMTALHSAVDFFNTGSTPNEAVTKAAAQHDFNPDQTQRLVETFNTARTIYHYKTAADRRIDFQLADPAAVVVGLFSDEKKAERPVAANYDYSDYDKPEADYSEASVIKSAVGVNDIEVPAPRVYQDHTLDTLGYRAQEQILVHRKLAEASRDEARIAGLQASKLLDKLASSLSLGYAEICEDRFNTLVGGYSKYASAATKEQYSPVVDSLMVRMPAWMQKSAAAIQDQGVYDDSKLQAEVQLLKTARQWMETESEMLAMASEMDKIADAYEREWTEAITPIMPTLSTKEALLSDFINPRLLKAAAGGYSETRNYTRPDYITGDDIKITAKKEPSDSGIGKLLMDSLKEPIGGAVSKGLDTGIRGILRVPTKQENEQLSNRLKNVQRQIMLEDLMTNDPVLSEENPENVSNAYMAVLNIAPELASNKEIIRAILRQSVHSVAIGPYEAETWTKLEQNIRNIAGKTDLKGRPVMEGMK